MRIILQALHDEPCQQVWHRPVWSTHVLWRFIHEDMPGWEYITVTLVHRNNIDYIGPTLVIRCNTLAHQLTIVNFEMLWHLHLNEMHFHLSYQSHDEDGYIPQYYMPILFADVISDLLGHRTRSQPKQYTHAIRILAWVSSKRCMTFAFKSCIKYVI